MSTKSDDFLILLAFSRVKLKLAELGARAFKQLGLGSLQAGIVRRLGESGTTSLADIARQMGLDPAAIGRACDTLIKKGWVLRVDDPKDRRRWQVSLSPKGHKLLAKVQDCYNDIASHFGAHLNRQERNTLLALLTKLETGLDKWALEREEP